MDVGETVEEDKSPVSVPSPDPGRGRGGEGTGRPGRSPRFLVQSTLANLSRRDKQRVSYSSRECRTRPLGPTSSWSPFPASFAAQMRASPTGFVPSMARSTTPMGNRVIRLPSPGAPMPRISTKAAAGPQGFFDVQVRSCPALFLMNNQLRIHIFYPSCNNNRTHEHLSFYAPTF